MKIRFLSSQRQLKSLSHEQSGLYEPTPKEAERMKRLTFEMYLDVKRFCDAHGLCLMLGGGSALGAVRHKGYIPWDDDIDLMMPREDYDKFRQLFNSELSEKYEIQTQNLPGSPMSAMYTKIVMRGTERVEIQRLNAPGEHGLWLDMFAIENAPNSCIMRALRGFVSNVFAYLSVSKYLYKYTSPELKKYMSGTFASKMNHNLRMFLGACLWFVSFEKMCCAFDNFSRYNHNTNWITVPTGIRHYIGEAHRREAYFPPRRCEFEGAEAFVPNDTHEYLSQLYGADYMTPPPENKRERHFYVTLKLPDGENDENA